MRFGLAGYGLNPEEVLTRPDWEAFNLVLEREMEAVLWHEAGEAGPGAAARGLLEKALRLVPGSDLEHFVRGAKDVLADTGIGGRLDRIIKARAAGTLGLYPAWLAGYPRMLFPEVDAAVMQFMADSDWSAVEEARLLGLARAKEAVGRLGEIMAGDDPENILARARAEVIGPLTGHRPAWPTKTDPHISRRPRVQLRQQAICRVAGYARAVYCQALRAQRAVHGRTCGARLPGALPLVRWLCRAELQIVPRYCGSFFVMGPIGDKSLAIAAQPS